MIKSTANMTLTSKTCQPMSMIVFLTYKQPWSTAKTDLPWDLLKWPKFIQKVTMTNKWP